MEKTLGKWVVCLLIGFVVGLLAYGIRWTVELLNDFKYETADHYIYCALCFFFFFNFLYFFYVGLLLHYTEYLDF
jgi:H+/Cl- antiporter ClcA